MTSIKNEISPIYSKALESDGFKHAFFTRHGGVSSGIYEGLNVGLGSDDSQKNVLENRSRVSAFFNAPFSNLATVFQIHSPNTVIVDGPMPTNRPKADSVVTATPGIIAGILTADCGPILFSDTKAKVVGAAHAGWKGATSGVIESTIKAMCSLGAKAENITAVLGPTISQENYEVGPEFAENLQNLSAENAKFLIPSKRKDHFQFDLPAYVIERLSQNGVNASWTGDCTYEQESSFFSFRRTTHRNESDYGRQISAIMIS